MSGEFYEAFGGDKKEKIMTVGAFKFHDFGFDFVLALLQDETGGGKVLGGVT